MRIDLAVLRLPKSVLTEVPADPVALRDYLREQVTDAMLQDMAGMAAQYEAMYQGGIYNPDEHLWELRRLKDGTDLDRPLDNFSCAPLSIFFDEDLNLPDTDRVKAWHLQRAFAHTLLLTVPILEEDERSVYGEALLAMVESVDTLPEPFGTHLLHMIRERVARLDPRAPDFFYWAFGLITLLTKGVGAAPKETFADKTILDAERWFAFVWNTLEPVSHSRRFYNRFVFFMDGEVTGPKWQRMLAEVGPRVRSAELRALWGL